MKYFETKIEGHQDKTFWFKCYENTEPIEVGDFFIFFWGGIADVQRCSKSGIIEINPNNIPRKTNCIDSSYGFWKNCYKIELTNFPLQTVDA
jgi:hypothetical protein